MRRLTVVVMLVTAGAGMGDILPPGHKAVRHDVRFEGAKDYPGYVFFLWPRDLPRGQPGNSSVRVPESGETTLGGNPLARGQAGGVFLFAVPKELLGPDGSQPPEEGWFEGKEPKVLKSAALVNEIRSAPQGEARDRFLTRYRIAIRDGKLETELLSEERPGAVSSGTIEGGVTDGIQKRWLIAGGLMATAVVLAVGLLLTRARRS